MEKTVSIIGAGLAGSEAALQLAKRGFKALAQYKEALVACGLL